MTDGPFRNAELSSRWKRYGQDLISDAASSEERVMQACHSMLGDVDTTLFCSIFCRLKAQANCVQMEMDPTAKFEEIFESYVPSLLGDALHIHLIANLRDQPPSQYALEQALESTTREWISTTKNRLDEECIRARSVGEMPQQDYVKGMERNQKVFASIDVSKLVQALTTGNRKAFSKALKKKTNLDDGPDP